MGCDIKQTNPPTGKNMKKFYIETYGCQMNVYDSELVTGILNNTPGYVAVDNPDEADIVMLNTCSVRDHAEEKIHSRLGELNKIRMERPGTLKVGVVGCMAQNLKKKLIDRKQHVDFVVGPDAYRRLPDILENENRKKRIIDTLLSKDEVYEGIFPSRKEGINAWISITRGCDKFCTYCIVPFTRGRERSRSVESIVEEGQLIAEQGFVELTLLGQNVNSYMHGKHKFPELLKAMTKIEGIKRIRYTSPHPQDVDEELLRVHADYLPLVADHIHLPLQSGSNHVLEAMNRTYTREHFLKLVEKIRKFVPSMAITTDIIVGFPGETGTDFRETMDMLKQVKFDAAFTFNYSPRPGTKAAAMEDDVPAEEKSARLSELIVLQKVHTLEHNQKYLGKDVEILVERVSKRRSTDLAGRTSQNKTVIFPAEDHNIKSIIKKKITELRGISLYAE